MVGKKKKRTVLMSEDPSEVTPRSLASKVKSFVSSTIGRVHTKKGGIGAKVGPASFSLGVIKSKLGANVKFKF